MHLLTGCGDTWAAGARIDLRRPSIGSWLMVVGTTRAMHSLPYLGRVARDRQNLRGGCETLVWYLAPAGDWRTFPAALGGKTMGVSADAVPPRLRPCENTKLPVRKWLTMQPSRQDSRDPWLLIGRRDTLYLRSSRQQWVTPGETFDAKQPCGDGVDELSDYILILPPRKIRDGSTFDVTSARPRFLSHWGYGISNNRQYLGDFFVRSLQQTNTLTHTQAHT